MTKKEQIIELRNQGLSRSKICEQVKCGRSYISSVLQEADLTKEKIGIPDKNFIELMHEGHSIYRIAKILGITWCGANTRVKKLRNKGY